jgi:hypothetical protein
MVDNRFQVSIILLTLRSQFSKVIEAAYILHISVMNRDQNQFSTKVVNRSIVSKLECWNISGNSRS